MKTLLSLFDYSGIWSAPFAKNGWEVIQWDIKLQSFMDINFFTDAGQVLEMFENVDGIIAAPPCTDFTVSGSQYWIKKDANGTTAKSLQMVYQVQRLVDLFAPTDPDYDGVFFWAVENPVGRMAKLTGLDNPLYFHPCDYAGHLSPTEQVLAQLEIIRKKNGYKVTDAENDFVLKYNAYTKKTGLWGQFNRNLVIKRIEPVKTAPQGTFTQRYGGKSEKTKELRSNTPEGFAIAFYEANKDFIYTEHRTHPMYE